MGRFLFFYVYQEGKNLGGLKPSTPQHVDKAGADAENKANMQRATRVRDCKKRMTEALMGGLIPLLGSAKPSLSPALLRMHRPINPPLTYTISGWVSITGCKRTLAAKAVLLHFESMNT